MKLNPLPKTLLDIIANKSYKKDNGDVKLLDDAISIEEANSIIHAIHSLNATTTLETGVAGGISALAICNQLKNMHSHSGVKHYGIDPNQTTDYGSAALNHLKQEKLNDVFELLEGSSHMMIPSLIDKKVEIDFALIDGWHTFDYTLVDFFLVDKILKVGGIIAFHDCHSMSKQKVLRYIETHRKYEYAEEFFVRGNESFKTRMKFFLWRIKNRPGLLFSKFHWRYQFKNSSGLFFIRKVESFEPNFDFYNKF